MADMRGERRDETRRAGEEREDSGKTTEDNAKQSPSGALLL